MSTEKKTIVCPVMTVKKPAEVLFACITGDGVDDYDGYDKEYTITIKHASEKDANAYKKEVLNYYKDSKPQKAPDTPANEGNIVYKNKNGDLCSTFRTKVKFGDKVNVIPMVDGRGNRIDPANHNIGAGSTVRVMVNLVHYSSGKKNTKYGISTFLQAIRLIKFVPFTGGVDMSLFDEIDDGGDDLTTGGFDGDDELNKKELKKAKKKKGKKSKN